MELSNEVLGRYIDEVRTSYRGITSDISDMKTNMALVQKSTEVIPQIQKDVQGNKDSILTINVKHETEEKTILDKRKSNKNTMYVVLFLITVSSAYGAVVLNFFSQ